MSEVDTEKVYKKIKKQNGEAVAQVIRDAVLLDVPDIVAILEFAGNHPDEIKLLVPVIREIYKTQQESKYHINKNPLELLSDAGYDAFVVKTAEQKDSIKKYFRSGEELCTFRDPTRHENYYMIHAIKRGADKIKPSEVPDRQDEYGTSVISIQIAKNGGFISIKNRYNHTVNNPDNTFNSNPDNIIHGLTNSLKKYFHVNFNTTNSSLPDHFRMVNNQLVRFNYEIENTYFGPDYYFSGSNITKLNKDYELMLDCFVLNAKTMQVQNPGNLTWANGHDSSYDVLSRVFDGKHIVIEKSSQNKHEKIVFADNQKIAVVVDGQMTELNLPNIRTLLNASFTHVKKLKKLNMPDMRKIGDDFLTGNEVLESLNAPELEIVGKDFLTYNRALKVLDLPNVTDIGPYSLQNNVVLEYINLPKSKSLGYLSTLQPNLKYFYVPNLPDDIANRYIEAIQYGGKLEVAFLVAKSKVQKKIDDLVKDAKQKLAAQYEHDKL